MSEIGTEYSRLEKARREFSRAAMAEYDKGHYAALRVLRAKCEEQTGHNMVFSHLGPLGNPWHYCTHCKATKVDPL